MVNNTECFKIHMRMKNAMFQLQMINEMRLGKRIRNENEEWGWGKN